ncbi:hypothetical protein NPIL_307821, partial [Nephila pilipes]
MKIAYRSTKIDLKSVTLWGLGKIHDKLTSLFHHCEVEIVKTYTVACFQQPFKLGKTAPKPVQSCGTMFALKIESSKLNILYHALNVNNLSSFLFISFQGNFDMH